MKTYLSATFVVVLMVSLGITLLDTSANYPLSLRITALLLLVTLSALSATYLCISYYDDGYKQLLNDVSELRGMKGSLHDWQDDRRSTEGGAG